MATSSDLSVSVSFATTGVTLNPPNLTFCSASTESVTFSISSTSPNTGTLTGFALSGTNTGVTLNPPLPVPSTGGQSLPVTFVFAGSKPADGCGFTLSYTSQGTASSTTGQVMNNGTTVRYDPSGPHG